MALNYVENILKAETDIKTSMDAPAGKEFGLIVLFILKVNKLLTIEVSPQKTMFKGNKVTCLRFGCQGLDQEKAGWGRGESST